MTIIITCGCIINVGAPITSQPTVPTVIPEIVTITPTPTPTPISTPILSDTIEGTWANPPTHGGYIFYPDHTVTHINYDSESMTGNSGIYIPTSPPEYDYGVWTVDGGRIYTFYLNRGDHYDGNRVSPTYQILLREDKTFNFIRVNRGEGYTDINGPPFYKVSDYPDLKLILYREQSL